MANIENITNIVKALESLTDETLAAIIDNDAVEVSELKDSEKLCVLVYDALTKGLNNSKYQLVLDANFGASKFRGHEDPAEDLYRVDYYRVVSTTAPNTSLMQVYCKPTRKADGIKFSICTSARKFIIEQLAAHEELGFKTLINKTTGKPKTSCRDNIEYEELVQTIKTVLAILAKQPATPAKAAKKRKEEVSATTEEEILQVVEEFLEEAV